MLLAILHCVLWQPAGSWIALNKDGYTIKHNLIAEAGVEITGDLRVNGVLMSKPVSNIQCNAEREGSIRWNDKYFESCDGVNDWQPVQFCDRSCAVNAHAVPCGVAVLNTCGVDCNQVGTGLNMRQCLLKTATWACNTEVMDNCGNSCGITGQFDCDSKEARYGGVVIKSLDHSPSTAGFEFTVQADDPSNKDSLFLTYKNLGGISQVLTLIKRLNDEANGITGMEFAKPPGQHEATMRVSMFTELTGELIRLGKSVSHSQLFVDGVLDKECPLVFNGGVHDGNFTKICLETPTQQRTLTFPDASGTVITSGNREDITHLPGLEGDNTLVYTGSYRDLRGVQVPRRPRVSCRDFDCNSNLSFPDAELRSFLVKEGTERKYEWEWGVSGEDGSHLHGCSSLSPMDYTSHQLDVFRVYYMLDEGRDVSHPEALKEALSFASSNIRAPEEVRTALREFWQAYENQTAFERPRLDLVLRFLRLMAEEQGLDSAGALHENFDALLQMYQFGEVTNIERCFVCCGAKNVSTKDKDGRDVYMDTVQLGLVPEPRIRPRFCVGGDKDGSICRTNCVGAEACGCPGGGVCVEDPTMSCFEHDFGFKCYDFTQRPNFTSTVNFTEPTAQRQLMVPDASGTFITTGNLEDITSVGVLTSSIVAQSSNDTTTTLQFERCTETSGPKCGMRQVSSNLKNNTLLVPSASDGIILTTGNLEDVTLDSGSMSGLSVATDVQVNGLLQFGDTATSGIRLPPREGSVHYTHPHGKQIPGNSIVGDGRGPGQLAFLVDDGGSLGPTTRVFEFEPRDPDDPRDTTYLTVPARNGTAITTGNLESVTKEAGTMTSISVAGSSYLQGGLTLGDKDTYGKPTLTLKGSVSETIVHRNPVSINETHARLRKTPHPNDKWSVTKIGFHTQHQARSNLQFPAASGTIITTGNLHDISMFDGELLNVSGTSHLRGPVRLGSNRSTPISFSGFLEGDIVSRTAPRYNDRGTNVEHVPGPNSWGLRPSAFCSNGVPYTANADTLELIAARFPSFERYNGSWVGVGWGERFLYTHADEVSAGEYLGHSQELYNMSQEFVTHETRDAVLYETGRMVFDTPANCREKCFETPNKRCGIVVRSRYLRGSIRIVVNTKDHYITAVPLNASECPGVAPSGALHGASWVRDVPCQRAALLDVTSEQVRAWGPEHMALADIDVVIARCRSDDGNDWKPCWDIEMCMGRTFMWHDKTCEVSFRQHSTGAYLGTQSGDRCYRHGKFNMSKAYTPEAFTHSSICTGWQAEPALWRFEPKPGKTGVAQHLSRVGACAELGPMEATDPTPSKIVPVLCDMYHGSEGVDEGVHTDSYVKSLDFFEWGEGIQGVCGAYNTSKLSCVREADKTRWAQAIQEKCVENPGCFVLMDSEGAVSIMRANKQGKLDAENGSAIFARRADCDVRKASVVVQARCAVDRYMSVAKVKDENGVDDNNNLIVASVGGVKGDFQLSTLQVMKDTVHYPKPMLHECWLSYTRGPNCLLEAHAMWDVDFYMRDEATRLVFQTPSDSQTQWFPDADGTIITTGNVEQISHLRGLQGRNSFIFSSGDQAQVLKKYSV